MRISWSLSNQRKGCSHEKDPEFFWKYVHKGETDCIHAGAGLMKRRMDVKENTEKNRENAHLSVKTPIKNVEKMACPSTIHAKHKNRNHKPRSN